MRTYAMSKPPSKINILMNPFGNPVDISSLFGKEQNMVKKLFVVDTICNELSQAVQRAAFTFGFTWNSGFADVKSSDRYLVFYDDQTFTQDNSHNPEMNVPCYSVNGNWHRIIEVMAHSQQIKIGQHKVEFKDDHIQIGCQSVSHETVKKIYDRCFNK